MQAIVTFTELSDFSDRTKQFATTQTQNDQHHKLWSKSQLLVFSKLSDLSTPREGKYRYK